ncbi:MAG: NAD(P)/FAD-dependent oxidoreductase [Chloroflexi bacterium]|nr:NAD(P)/FAD-dependent oxidoreductase [Chloroflexota bacterium]
MPPTCSSQWGDHAERLSVVVVGAGLADLNCARLLAQHQVPVQVLEVSSGVGGRVCSGRTSDGFVLDHGFQVLFYRPALPCAGQSICAGSTCGCSDTGAAVVTTNGPTFLRDPLRNPELAAAALSAHLLTWRDRLRLARLGLALLRAGWDGTPDVPFQTIPLVRPPRPARGGFLFRKHRPTAATPVRLRRRSRWLPTRRRARAGTGSPGRLPMNSTCRLAGSSPTVLIKLSSS